MNNQEQEILYGNRHPYLEEGVRIASILGLFFHSAMTFYFLYLNILEMVYFNFVSIALYTGCTIIIHRNKKFAFKIFALCSIEVILHAFFGVYYLGVGSGLSLFIWLIIFLFSLSSRTRISDKIRLVIFISFLYMVLLIYGFNYPPVYLLNDVQLAYLNQFSSLACFTVMVMVAIYYSRIIKNKEEIILREIHHRILNNLQLLSSFTKIQMYYKEDSSEDFKGILSKMDAIKAVHKNIRFKGNKLTAELSSILTNLIQNKRNIRLSYGSSNICEMTLEESIPIGVLIQEIIQLYHFETLQINLTTNTQNKKFEILFEYEGKRDKEGLNQSIEIIEDLIEQIDGIYIINQKGNTSSFLLKA